MIAIAMLLGLCMMISTRADRDAGYERAKPLARFCLIATVVLWLIFFVPLLFGGPRLRVPCLATCARAVDRLYSGFGALLPRLEGEWQDATGTPD